MARELRGLRGNVVCKPEVLAPFGERCRYFNTFGGNPVSSAAGMAVLDVIEREGLLQNAQSVGAALKRELVALAEQRAVLDAVRGAGLFLAVDIADAEAASTIVNGMRDRRVLISATGPRGDVLKIRPPLTFSADNAAQFTDVLKATLDSL